MGCASSATFDASVPILAARFMPLLFLAACEGEAILQPLVFNHRTHVRSNVDCLACHEGVLDPRAEPMPAARVCVECHRTDNPPKNVLERLGADGEPLLWQTTLRLPDHVFFTHVRHVDVAGLDCVACHLEIAVRKRPPSHVRTFPMSRCLACHESAEQPSARAATTDCARCHR